MSPSLSLLTQCHHWYCNVLGSIFGTTHRIPLLGRFTSAKIRRRPNYHRSKCGPFQVYWFSSSKILFGSTILSLTWTQAEGYLSMGLSCLAVKGISVGTYSWLGRLRLGSSICILHSWTILNDAFFGRYLSAWSEGRTRCREFYDLSFRRDFWNRPKFKPYASSTR